MANGLVGGRYELLNRLGAGGMGEVYRSRDRLTEEIVALKRALQMPTTAAGPPSDAEDVARFTEADDTTAVVNRPTSRRTETPPLAQLALASEFRVLSSLRHPNIVSVLDYGFQSSGLPFFTMNLLADA